MTNANEPKSEQLLPWTPPVLERLDVDLKSIATGTPDTTDTSPGAHTS